MKSGFGKLVYVESKKVVHSSIFRLSFLVLLVVNLLILFLYEKGVPISTASYRKFKNEYEMMGNSEKERLSEATKKCDKLLVIDQIKFEAMLDEQKDWNRSMSYSLAKEFGYSETWYLDVRKDFASRKISTYSESPESEKNLTFSIKEELEQIASRNDYIKSIQKKADDKKAIKIIQENQTVYSKRESEKVITDYQKVANVKARFVGSIGLSRVLGNIPLDICPCLMITIILSTLFMEEKKNGNLKLYRATFNGREKLFWAKIVVQIALSAITIILFWGSCFVYIWKSYGAVSLTAPVQSILGYQNCTLTLSIGQYIVLYLFVKLLALSVLSSIGTILAVIAANYVTYYLGIGIIGLYSVLCYACIPKYTAFSWLRLNNIIYIMQGKAMLKEYLNLNVLGYPVHHGVVCISVAVLVMLIGVALGKRYYMRSEAGYHSLNLISPKNKGYSKRMPNVSSILHEFYKMLIGKKVLLLLAVAFTMLLMAAKKQNVYLTEDEYYYQNYMKRLEGNVTDEKRNYMKEEELRISKIENKINEFYVAFENGDISEAVLKENTEFLEQKIKGRNAFERVKERMAYLDKTGHEKYSFVYDDGWKQLLGFTESGRKNNLLSALICVLLIILSVSGCMAGDYESGLSRLQKVSVKGRSALWIRKMLISALIIVLNMAIVYMRDVILAHKTYGLNGLLAQAKSIPELDKVIGSGGNILFQCLTVFCVRFIGYMLILLVIYLLALYTKSTIKTIIVSVVLFALPIALSLLEIHQFDLFSLNTILSGQVIMY